MWSYMCVSLYIYIYTYIIHTAVCHLFLWKNWAHVNLLAELINLVLISTSRAPTSSIIRRISSWMYFWSLEGSEMPKWSKTACFNKELIFVKVAISTHAQAFCQARPNRGRPWPWAWACSAMFRHQIYMGPFHVKSDWWTDEKLLYIYI